MTCALVFPKFFIIYVLFYIPVAISGILPPTASKKGAKTAPFIRLTPPREAPPAHLRPGSAPAFLPRGSPVIL